MLAQWGAWEGQQVLILHKLAVLLLPPALAYYPLASKLTQIWRFLQIGALEDGSRDTGDYSVLISMDLCIYMGLCVYLRVRDPCVCVCVCVCLCFSE